MIERIKVWYEKDAIARLESPVHTGDVGYDIRLLDGHNITVPCMPPIARNTAIAEVNGPNIEVVTQHLVKIHTGIHIQLPHGKWAQIVDKSSVAAGNSKRVGGLHVVAGIIDTGYTGEIIIAIANLMPQYMLIEGGSGIAQIVIHDAHTPELFLVNDKSKLDTTGRGEGGFGSTG